MERILITGASGLLGSNLVIELLDRDKEIIGVSKNYPNKTIKHPKLENFIQIQCDIRNYNDLKNIVDKYQPTEVIHLAAQAIVVDSIDAPINTFETNIQGTWNVLEAIKGLKNIKHVIIASSDKAYGEHKDLPYKESHPLQAIHPYDVSKKITEDIAWSYYNTNNIPITITRCGNIYGPFDLNKSRIVPGTIESCLQHKEINLRSSGLQTRCYIYVKDVVDAYIAILNAPTDQVKGEVFNIGHNQEVSVLSITQKICELMNVDISTINIQNNAKFEISNQSLDSSKIQQILNWKPQYSLDEGLRKTIDWYEHFNKDHGE